MILFKRLRTLVFFCLVLLLILLVFCFRLIIQKPLKLTTNDVYEYIDDVKDISIFATDNYHGPYNISKTISFKNMKSWLVLYCITHLFDYRWFETGAYEWHLQRMYALNNNKKLTTGIKSKIFVNDILTYLNHHLEQGVIIDSAQHLFNPLFHPMPQTGSSLDYTCTEMKLTDSYLPCKTRRPEIVSLSSLTTTYTLTAGIYDAFIDTCGTIYTQIAQFLKRDCSNSVITTKTSHYNELINVINVHMTNPTCFVVQILPKIIRLLAVTPESALLLLPSNVKIIEEYVNVLIERGLIDKNRTRLINYESNKIYHANVVYHSENAPYTTILEQYRYHRSDMQLLHRTLSNVLVQKSRDLIIIIKSHTKVVSNYNNLIQTINQVILPGNFDYLKIQEFIANEGHINEHIKQFQRARIVIGIHGDELVNIIYCKPGIHVIEIGHEQMSDVYFQIATHSNHKYWLAIGHKETEEKIFVDTADIRNILLKLYSEIDNR
ncbi:unnamed protein product [Didymodactylos carnosus]|uniref:Glycosyltransferase 61 catalytic domain-containing protein n=1 Tax=Didymodactylos carnosus TaxID=1234261 RepID=A0A814C050_9BILA|nr:unnamed protein product [Didymodactylos carnosus]CAF0937261.1 unnamed protein product [Didymodactylos carnosus]CAF3554530.1 unnamed protein product [Didymodactylos carnosus]CAF3714274.1 unnamed protein product [Didymodactylos carnosus]